MAISLVVLALFSSPGFQQPAFSQSVACTSTLNQTQVLASFLDNTVGAITPRNVRDYVCSTIAGSIPFTILTTPQTTKFFSNDSPPANIDKFGDRVLIGDAFNFNTTLTTTGTDWFTLFECSTSNGCFAYAGDASLIVENGHNVWNSNAILGAVQTLNCGVFNSCTVQGVSGFAVNNGGQGSGVSGYFECDITVATITSGGGCSGIEIDVGNAVSNAAAGNPDPYGQTGINTLQLACGSGISSPAMFECGSAMQIEPNTKTFNAGIIFGAGSITAGVATGGTTAAIMMPSAYYIVWDTASNTFGGSITVDTSKNMLTKSTGIRLQDSSGNPFFDCNVSISSTCDFAYPLVVSNTGTVTGTLTTNGSLVVAPTSGTATVQITSPASQQGVVNFKQSATNEWQLAMQTSGTELILSDVPNSVSALDINGSTTKTVTVGYTTATSSPTTGAMIVSGGLGVGGQIYAGGNVNISPSSGASILNYFAPTGQQAGQTFINGATTEWQFLNQTNGVELLFYDAPNNTIALDINGGGTKQITIGYTTATSSTSTGSLIVNGGEGIAGGIIAGGSIRTNTGFNANGSAGVTQTCTVNQAKTLIFTLGILTGGTCNT